MVTGPGQQLADDGITGVPEDPAGVDSADHQVSFTKVRKGNVQLSQRGEGITSYVHQTPTTPSGGPDAAGPEPSTTYEQVRAWRTEVSELVRTLGIP